MRCCNSLSPVGDANLLLVYPARRWAAAACHRSQSDCKPIQNSGEVLKRRARRSAVSAVTPRRPLMISLRRFSGIRILRAASTWVSPEGRRNSSSSISPGGVGGRFKSSTDRGPSMVIFARDIISLTFFESKRDSILVVHSDAEVSGTGTLQRFQPVACGKLQVLEAAGLVDRVELSANHQPQILRQLPRSLRFPSVVDVRSRLVSERPDHVSKLHDLPGIMQPGTGGVGRRCFFWGVVAVRPFTLEQRSFAVGTEPVIFRRVRRLRRPPQPPLYNPRKTRWGRQLGAYTVPRAPSIGEISPGRDSVAGAPASLDIAQTWEIGGCPMHLLLGALLA